MLITQLRHHVEISLWLTLEGRNDHAYRQGRKNGRKNICRLLKSYTTHCLKIAQKVSISQNQPKLEFWFFVKNLNFRAKTESLNFGKIIVRYFWGFCNTVTILEEIWYPYFSQEWPKYGDSYCILTFVTCHSWTSRGSKRY